MHLNEICGDFLAAYRSLQDVARDGDRVRVGPAELPRAGEQLLAGTTRPVLAVTGWPDLLGLLPPRRTLTDAAARGAKVRVLGCDKLRADRAGGPSLLALASGGVQVATVPVTPPALVIVDGWAALATQSGPPGEDGKAFISRDPEVAGCLTAVVDSLWATALPLRDGGTAAGGLSPADQALLRLLAQGRTQQEAARTLHLSVRTVSRRIADLKQDLEAGSPLQMGMEAARRGWL